MDEIFRNWKENSEQQEDSNFMFIRSLKMRDPEPVDKLAENLHEEVFNKINCLDCGNCCKTSKPTLEDSDIERISEHLNQSIEAVKENYLELDEDKDWTFNSLPCPFLEEDNKCQIYNSRPSACQEFPHTNKEGFATRSYQHSWNTIVCPAAYYIVDKMKRLIG